MGRAALALCATSALGCGRLNFNPVEGDGSVVLTNPILLGVVEGKPDGNKVARANVAVVVEDGTIERTDENGELLLDGTIPRTFHVVYEIAGGQRVTSLYEIEGGTQILLGPREFANRATVPYAINFPPIGGATFYQISISTRCTQDVYYETAAPPFMVDVAVECVGELLTGFLLAGTATMQLGSASIGFQPSDGGSVALQGWDPPEPAGLPLTIRNVPSGTADMFVSAQIVSGEERLLAGTITASPPYANPTLVSDSFRGDPNTIGVFALGTNASSSLILAAPTFEIDAAQMLPYASSSRSDRTITWSPMADSDIQRVEAIAPGAEWILYAPSALGSATFPALPAELASADPGPTPAWQIVTQAIDVFGRDTTDLLRDVDREWPFWNSWAARIPEGGMRIAGSTPPP